MHASDAERVFEIQSNWNVTRMLSRASFPPILDEVRIWLGSHAREWSGGKAYRFGVERDGVLIGCADVDEIDGPSGSLGYWFDERYWGCGLASEAATAARDFVIQRVGLSRLVAGHAEDNGASGRVLTKLGFRPTGTAIIWSKPRQQNITERLYEFDRHEAVL